MAEPEEFAIAEAAARVGLDPDTLRYYERRGIVPAPRRDAAGRRVYDAVAVHLIEVLMHLRNTGMPLARIAEFTRLAASDPDGVPERLALLEAHRSDVERRAAELRASLALIDQKIADYRARSAPPP